ncbi:TPA: hypothetical protein L4T59_001341 [Pseudomonas aeruginosa]|nr:hypothetical protein [Pseudomonas aeruginosa]MCV0166697.1 hypothetical protein [Pseudomonas aeruginosa]QBN00370.1 hypothetical protein CKAES1M_03745 [Pseudomonas aeruginosa]QBN04502.1 hypothetical protein CKAES1R_01982 [Pseudomonas aeruginosa]RCL96748.1 hypothetical protein PA66_02505 [Pseudomonas aeruginosa]
MSAKLTAAARASDETPEAKAKRKRRAARPVYMTWRRMVDPDTGEERLALVAESGIDRFLLKERGYHRGDQMRVELKKPRNYKFHCLVHQLGVLVSRNIDVFAGMDAHSVIKRLQGEAGVCCTVEQFDIPDLGRVTRSIPESLAFDEMPEERFREFWKGLGQYLIAKYWPSLTEERIDEMVGLMPAEGG